MLLLVFLEARGLVPVGRHLGYSFLLPVLKTTQNRVPLTCV
jgi:hypothetical protein